MNIAALILAGPLMLLSVRAAQAQQVVMFSSHHAPVHSQLFIANGDGDIVYGIITLKIRAACRTTVSSEESTQLPRYRKWITAWVALRVGVP